MTRRTLGCQRHAIVAILWDRGEAATSDVSARRVTSVFCVSLILLSLTSAPASLHAQPQEPTISIQPAAAMYGTAFSMTISGLEAGEEVTLKARSTDSSGITWASSATYRVDDQGTVDLSSQPPLSGDYDEPDVMGLLWSMTPSDGESTDRVYRPYSPFGIGIRFGLTTSTGQTATAHLKRYYQEPDESIVRVPLDAHGCKGLLYHPGTGGPFPGIILLSGSGGSMSEFLARMLASNGFATLTLAYYGYPGLPAFLEEIPLEYFEGAIKWMQGREAVRKGKLTLVGHSKGGECSLLLASLHDSFNAVVAYVPSAYVWKCISPNAKSSWSLGGKGLPFISTVETEEEVQQYMRGELSSLRRWFTDGLAAADPALIEEAVIPVERIRAPILLVSDTDDRTWPSSEFCERITDRLEAHEFQYEYVHIRSQKAGHHVYRPDFIPGHDEGENGGEARDKVKWSLIVWEETLAFLNRHLQTGSVE